MRQGWGVPVLGTHRPDAVTTSLANLRENDVYRSSPPCKVTPVILHGVVSPECKATAVILHGVVSPDLWPEMRTPVCMAHSATPSPALQHENREFLY